LARREAEKDSNIRPTESRVSILWEEMAKAKKADAAAAPAAEGDAPAKVESPKKETAPKAGKVAKRGRKKKASPKKTKGKKKAAKKWSATRELSCLCNFQAALFWMGLLTVVFRQWCVYWIGTELMDVECSV